MTAALPWLEASLIPVATVAHDENRAYPIKGYVAEGFEPVLRAFIENFESGEEVGACACLWLGNERVVDLWGGYADRHFQRPWEEETIVNAMSTTKAVAATCFHVLVDRGIANYDDPIDRYWPEFSSNGKAGIPIRYILDHRIGLPTIPLSCLGEGLFDWDAMTSALAVEQPLWKPGTAAGYHVRTYGFLLGEVVRRITGQTIGAFFRKEIAVPLGIDFHIGLPESELLRCADFIAERRGTIYDAKVDPSSLLARTAPSLEPEIYNSRAWRIGELPSSNGHGNARSLSRMYAFLANQGELDGLHLLSPETIERATAVQHRMQELVMGRTYNQALGYLRNSPPIAPMGPRDTTFGHHGVGGSLAFADPVGKMAFAYVMNKMHSRLEVGPRAGRLIEASYASTGMTL